MTDDLSVGLVGLGTIAATHLDVLAGFPHVELTFAVDPDTTKSVSFKGTAVPRYEQVKDALAAHQPDLVVVTSPTHTHAGISSQVLHESQARVLVEKPLVHDLDSLAEVRRSLDSDVGFASRVFVAHHFAFSPEVRWGAAQLAQNPGWGPITRITTAFHDPYITDAEHSFAVYESSWIDSGVNQLSTLARYVDLVERGPIHESHDGATSWCNVTYQSGDHTGRGLLRASWEAVASSKRTTLELGRSGTEIWLDHTAVTAFVTRDGQVVASLTNDGSTPRKVAHYRPLYESLLSGAPDSLLSIDTAIALTELLHVGHPRSKNPSPRPNM